MTSDRTDAIAAYDDAVHAFLTQSAAVETNIARALSVDPGLLLAHVLRGFVARLSARRVYDPVVEASRAAATAAITERGASSRESLMAQALDLFAQDQIEPTLACLDQVLAADPLDAMAVKLKHSICFQIGQTLEMRRSIEAILPAWQETTPGYGYIIGCRAFAHGETGDLAAAETFGRSAVLRCPDDRWGAHALAHVLEMQALPEVAISWIDRLMAMDPQADGFHRHLIWHRALAFIGMGQLDAALDAFDTGIWAQPVVEYRDVANAVSLLRRVEMAGGSAGGRWESICAASAALLDDRRLAFADGHALIGLIRAGKHALAARAILRLEEASDAGDLSPVHYPTGTLEMLRGLLTNDADLIGLGLPNLDRLGGSIVQRDLFLRSAIDALNANQNGQRAAYLLNRRAQRFAPCRWSRGANRRAKELSRSAAA